MIPMIIIEPDLVSRMRELENILIAHKLHRNHPNLIWVEDEKLGIQAVRKIQDHLSLKPYQDNFQAVVITAADELTLEAQNAFLKTLEEPAGDSLILLGASSEYNFLPTVLSRCQIVYSTPNSLNSLTDKQQKKIEELINSSIEQRFQLIERVDDKEELLHNLVVFFHQRLHQNPKALEFLQELIQAEVWAKSNVNIRAILEYLMLLLPPDDSLEK